MFLPRAEMKIVWEGIVFLIYEKWSDVNDNVSGLLVDIGGRGWGSV